MKQAFILVLLFLSTRHLPAQSRSFIFHITGKTVLKEELQTAIGNKFDVFDVITGDITKDRKTDIIVIGSPKTDKDKNRAVFIFVNRGKQLFRLVAWNENIIGCEQCGGAGAGDPYRKTIIKNNSFSFESLYGDCAKENITVSFTCNPKKNNWFLLREVSQTYNCRQENNPGNRIKISTKEKNRENYGKLAFADYH